ncbi:MAG: cytochrome c biogenesis CcdA family protein [Terracoccus sp.]
MTDVGFLGALAAGVLALLSPCSALLLPSFFAYAFTTRSALVARTSVFYVGLLITLVPLGTGAALASQVFYGHRAVLIAVAGWVIISIGVIQVLGGSFAVPFADRLQGWAGRYGSGRGGYVSTLVLGAVYGLAGFCSGPVLGAILTLAATGSNPVGGALLLAVYALGMALPLFVLAAFWDRFRLGERRWLRGRMLHLGPVTVHSSALASGLLFIAIGALFLRFDGTAGIVGVLGLGDTTDLEVNAQNAVTSATVGFPIWVFPAGVALIAGGVALRRRLRHG